MRLSNLFKVLRFDDVWKELHQGKYPNLIMPDPDCLHASGQTQTDWLRETREDYAGAFRELQKLAPARSDPPMSIAVYPIFNPQTSAYADEETVFAYGGWAPRGCLDVFLDYEPFPDTLGITYTYWDFVLCLDVYGTCLRKYGHATVAAAILRAMTYYGFTMEEFDRQVNLFQNMGENKDRETHVIREPDRKVMDKRGTKRVRTHLSPRPSAVAQAEFEQWPPEVLMANVKYREERGKFLEECRSF
ncbi:Uncharacterised protein [Slackia heliotrinireducens]|uniref:Uncharacterized protein n=1 Tax=Slackia heliotrinireducens (strain ATCC 29202 / DSM 20476 / NCTC 11029 / RHS 1) TaxID=471855 RepID=C7N4E1_SLAHD|nr:DUF6557 family protein [Slackia heliotrinireducens]ACV21776.1 hypothetical protein Shel_07180 [Slackia heliotrinireducens DSM 20476]VEG99449.1 Uncharacterised protein [Slackia heliotrinireducens]